MEPSPLEARAPPPSLEDLRVALEELRARTIVLGEQVAAYQIAVNQMRRHVTSIQRALVGSRPSRGRAIEVSDR